MIVGYQYSAEHYCENCTATIVVAQLKSNYPTWAFPEGASAETLLDIWADALGIDRSDEYSFDSDNFPKELLDSQEAGDTPDFCGSCRILLDTSWHAGPVNYAVEALGGYVKDFIDKKEVDDTHVTEHLDALRDRLGNCVVDKYDDAVMELYDRVREEDNV